MVGTVGALRRPSAQAVNEAISLLNALGGNKDKNEILRQIKEAQSVYEQVISDSQKAKAETEQKIAEFRSREANILTQEKELDKKAKTLETLLKNARESEKKLKVSLDEVSKEIEAHRKKALDFDAEMTLRVNDIKAREYQAQVLMNTAQAELDKASSVKELYEGKLKKILSVANE